MHPKEGIRAGISLLMCEKSRDTGQAYLGKAHMNTFGRRFTILRLLDFIYNKSQPL